MWFDYGTRNWVSLRHNLGINTELAVMKNEASKEYIIHDPQKNNYNNFHNYTIKDKIIGKST